MSNVQKGLLTCISSSLEYKSVPKRATHMMNKLFTEDPEEFSLGLENIFLQLSELFHKDPYAERGIKTILSFFAESKDLGSTPIQTTLLNFFDLVLMGCESKDKTPRYACVWTLDHLQRLAFESIDIPSSFHERIMRVNSWLIRDKCASIRYHAVNIYLKHSKTAEILQAMNNELNKEIRKHMLKSLRTDKTSAKAISKKLKDVDGDVRLLSCSLLREISDWKYCKDILGLVVTDRDQRVREMAHSTLKEFVNEKGLAKLGKLFKVHNLGMKKQNEVLAGLKYVCIEIAEKAQLAEVISSCIPTVQELELEELLILRFACESLKEKDENLLYSLMPCFEKLNLSLEHHDFPWWYTQNLVKIGLCLDLGEESTRFALLKTLQQLCLDYPVDPMDYKDSLQIQETYSKTSINDFLATSTHDVFSSIISGIRSLYKDQETEFCRVLVELINEARDPLVPSETTKSSLFTKKSQLEATIKTRQEEDSILESELKSPLSNKKKKDLQARKEMYETEIKQLQEELNETQTQIEQGLQRTLMLTCELLRFTKPESIDDEVSEIIKSLIYPSLQFQEPYIKVLAIECLGLYCLNNPQACTEYLYIFKMILQTCKVGILETVALRSVLDFYMVYSFTDSTQSDFSVSGTYMLDLLSEYLDCPNINMKAIAVEGFCKLLLLHRSSRADIVSKLLTMFFNTQSPDQIKQCLLVFFTHYPLVSQANSVALAEGFFLSISAISSSLNKETTGIDTNSLNLNKIFNFIFMYLDLGYLKEFGKFEPVKNLQFSIFYWICKEILKNPKGAQGKNYPKLIVQVNYLSFTAAESFVAYSLINKVTRVLGDKSSISALNKVAEGISKVVERVDRNCEDFTGKYEEEYQSVENKMKAFVETFPKIQDKQGKDRKIEMFLVDSPKKRRCLEPTN